MRKLNRHSKLEVFFSVDGFNTLDTETIEIKRNGERKQLYNPTKHQVFYCDVFGNPQPCKWLRRREWILEDTPENRTRILAFIANYYKV